MKKSILLSFSLLLFACSLKAQTIKLIPRADICADCVMDTTGGYTSIVDTMKWNPVCNYELLTKEHLALTHSLKIDRQKIPFFPAKMDNLYKGSGDSRGHVIPYEDLAWSPATAKASMDLRRNLAPEPQDQNVGTELHSEDYERQLADSLGSVKVYGGTFGTLGIMKGINKPEYYWKIIITPNEWIVYWMPTTGDQIKYQDLDSCKITEQQLTFNLGFDPMKAIK